MSLSLKDYLAHSENSREAIRGLASAVSGIGYYLHLLAPGPRKAEIGKEA